MYENDDYCNKIYVKMIHRKYSVRIIVMCGEGDNNLLLVELRCLGLKVMGFTVLCISDVHNFVLILSDYPINGASLTEIQAHTQDFFRKKYTRHLMTC